MGPSKGGQMTSEGGTTEPLLQMTDGAQVEVLGLLAGQEDPRSLGLWVEVTGVSGDDFTYNLSLRSLDEGGPDDVIEYHGELPVLIPRGSVDDLRGATIDLIGDLASGGLMVDNPNRPSPAVADFAPLDVSGDAREKVKQVLQRQVNPSIAMHGGRAELVSVEGDTAYLRLSGGCQGCGMASVTLARGIEVAIKRSVPEIEKIVDVTDHAEGVNPYYDPTEM